MTRYTLKEILFEYPKHHLKHSRFKVILIDWYIATNPFLTKKEGMYIFLKNRTFYKICLGVNKIPFLSQISQYFPPSSSNSIPLSLSVWGEGIILKNIHPCGGGVGGSLYK